MILSPRLGMLTPFLVCAPLAVLAAEPSAPTDQAAYLSAAPIATWDGVYAGGAVGFTHALWTVDFFRNNNHGHAEEGADGVNISGTLGYNKQLDNKWVVGVEGDIGYTSAEQRNNIFDNDTSLARYDFFATLRGRLGYTVDRALFYTTAGLAVANITNEIQKGRNAGEEVVADDKLKAGFTVGAGVEYLFAPNWSGKFEYLYANFGKDTYFNRDGNRAEFTNEIHLVRVGLNYRF